MAESHAKPLNPKQLVDEFKKSGEFDRLRRQLLTHFSSSDEVRPLMSRIEEIVGEKLSGDERLEHKSREAVHAEIMQDMERYPIVERAVTDLGLLKDDTLLMSIEQYARNILRGESNENTKLWEAKPSRTGSHEDEDNDESSDYTDDDEPDDYDLLIITDAKRNVTEPEAGMGIAMDGVVENGYTYPRSSPHLEIKPAISRSGTLPVLTDKDAVNTGPQTPPWPDPQEFKPSSPCNSHLSSGLETHLPAGALWSGVAEERLVNDVPIAEANDSARGGTSSPKELIAGPSEHNTQPRREEPSSSPRYSQAGELRYAPALQEINTNDLVMNSERSSTLSSPTHTPPLPHTSPLSSP